MKLNQHIENEIERLTRKPKNFAIVELQTLIQHKSVSQTERQDIEEMLLSDENASEA